MLKYLLTHNLIFKETVLRTRAERSTESCQVAYIVHVLQWFLKPYLYLVVSCCLANILVYTSQVWECISELKNISLCVHIDCSLPLAKSFAQLEIDLFIIPRLSKQMLISFVFFTWQSLRCRFIWVMSNLYSSII